MQEPKGASQSLLGVRVRRRLYAMGVIATKKSLVQLERLSTASFCRRRLSVVMVRLKMSETLREACTFIEQVRRVLWAPFLAGASPSTKRQRRSAVLCSSSPAC